MRGICCSDAEESALEITRQLAYTYFCANLYSHSDYDKVNSIFAETRENDSYGMNVMTNYMAPFGLRNWSLQLLAGYSKGDSNIDFYDTEGFSLGTFASYQF